MKVNESEVMALSTWLLGSLGFLELNLLNLQELPFVLSSTATLDAPAQNLYLSSSQ